MISPIFIIGFQKSATTFLHNIIAQHPDITAHDTKEIHFFNLQKKILDENFYRYEKLFSKKRFIDSSVSYIHDINALCEIKKRYKDAKIIILKRNKVDRVYSAFDHLSLNSKYELRKLKGICKKLVIMSKENSLENNERKLLEEAIMSKKVKKHCFNYHKQSFGWPIESKFNDDFWDYKYFSNSLYKNSIEKVQALFPLENILLLDLEELQDFTKEKYMEIFEFCNLGSFNFTLDVYNHSSNKNVLFIPLSIRKILSNILRKIFGNNLYFKIRNQLISNNKKDKSLKREIKKVFEAYNIN